MSLRRVSGLQIYTYAVFVFLFAPIVVVIVYAFHKTAALGLPFRGFSLRWMDSVTGNDEVRDAGRNSLVVSLAVGALVTVIGTLAAVATTRWRFRGRRVVELLILVPFLVPSLLYAVSLFSLYADAGVHLSVWTVAFGQSVVLLPIFFTIVAVRLSRFDPALEEVARDLGATPWQAFRRVVLPVVAPTILAGTLLVMANSWDELSVALFNAGFDNTVPLLIYTKVRVAVDPSINAIAAILLVVTTALLLAARRVVTELE